MITLVPSALMRGLVSGKSEKRALTGLVPNIAFHAWGFGPDDGDAGANRRLPCVGCCNIVVISPRRLSFGFRARRDSCPVVEQERGWRCRVRYNCTGLGWVSE